MKYKPWPKRDPIKNYFQLPNDIFLLGLSPGALAVYSYLICCENRNTYQCWPSYKTIGRAVRMSANTVRNGDFQGHKSALILRAACALVQTKKRPTKKRETQKVRLVPIIFWTYALPAGMVCCWEGDEGMMCQRKSNRIYSKRLNSYHWSGRFYFL